MQMLACPPVPRLRTAPVAGQREWRRRSAEHVCDLRPWCPASGDPLVNLTQTDRALGTRAVNTDPHAIVRLQDGSLSLSLFVRYRKMHWRKGANRGSGWLRPPPRMDGRVVQKALRGLEHWAVCREGRAQVLESFLGRRASVHKMYTD